MGFIEEYETQLEARAREEMAKEKVAWDALSTEERERLNAEREAYWESLLSDGEIPESEEDDQDEDDDTEADD